MALVKKIKHNYRQYKGGSGDNMHVHLITFENGDEGEQHSLSEICSDFEEGQVCDYSIEDRGMRNGKPEYRIKSTGNGNRAPQKSPNGNSGARKPSFNNNAPSKPSRNENAIMSQHAITKAIELFAVGGIQANNIYPKALEILQWTHKYGNMTAEEIAAIPVEFFDSEIKESSVRRGSKARAFYASDKSKLF